MVPSTARRGPVHVGELVAFVAGTVLLAGSWALVAAADHVPRFEARVFDAINGLSGFAWPVVWLPMQLGSFIGSLLVSATVLAVGRDLRLTVATLLAGQSAFWAAKSVKNIVLRARPNVLLVDVHVRDPATGLGYVSGHAAVAFALAASIGPSLPPRWRPVAIALPIVVGVARVYSGAHLPLDVVGGAGLGLLLGTLSRWVLGLGGEGLPVQDR